MRVELALVLEPLLREKAKAQQGTRTDLCQKSDKGVEPIDTKRELAKIAGVSPMSAPTRRPALELRLPVEQHRRGLVIAHIAPARKPWRALYVEARLRADVRYRRMGNRPAKPENST